MLIGSVLALGAFVMLAIPCTFQELRPDDFYWRLVAAFGIAAVACVIVPLTAVAMTRPKARRPPATAAEGTWSEAPGAVAEYPTTVPVPPGYSPAVAAQAPSSPLSVVGFIFSILFAPVGLVLSIVALAHARRDHRQSGFAVAGIVIGGIITAFWVLVIAGGIAAAVQQQARDQARDEADAAATTRLSSIVAEASPAYADAEVSVSSGYATIRLVADPEDVEVHDYAAIVHAIAAAYRDQDTDSRAMPLWSFSIEACLDGERSGCYESIPAAETLESMPLWHALSGSVGYYYSDSFAEIAELPVPAAGTPVRGGDEPASPSPSPSVPALQG